MKRILKALLALFIFSIFYANYVSAESRKALIIGNGAYPDAPLKLPPNDAQDMSETLRTLGFKVKTMIDADQVQMENAIKEFGQSLDTDTIGLFYFSGHGAQFEGITTYSLSKRN